MIATLGIALSTFGIVFCGGIALYNVFREQYALCIINLLCVLMELLCLIYWIQGYTP